MDFVSTPSIAFFSYVVLCYLKCTAGKQARQAQHLHYFDSMDYCSISTERLTRAEHQMNREYHSS